MILLINRKSCGGEAFKKWETIYPKLNLNNIKDTFYLGENGSDQEIIPEEIQKGETDFVIAGGDGTINFILNQLINCADPTYLKRIKIGAVGIGSSNDFHKPCNSVSIYKNISFKLDFDTATLRDVGCIKYENAGEYLNKYFLINASLGITAEGNNFFNNPDFILKYLKRISTQSAIIYTVLKNIFTYKNFKIKIESNNESFTSNISNMGVLKSAFFTGKLRFQSNPLLNNGVFDIHLYESLSKVKLLRLFYNLSRGISDVTLNKKFWRTGRIKISSETEFAVEFDGEVITTKHAEFYVIPELIKVCTN